MASIYKLKLDPDNTELILVGKVKVLKETVLPTFYGVSTIPWLIQLKVQWHCCWRNKLSSLSI